MHIVAYRTQPFMAYAISLDSLECGNTLKHDSICNSLMYDNNVAYVRLYNHILLLQIIALDR